MDTGDNILLSETNKLSNGDVISDQTKTVTNSFNRDNQLGASKNNANSNKEDNKNNINDEYKVELEDLPLESKDNQVTSTKEPASVHRKDLDLLIPDRVRISPEKNKSELFPSSHGSLAKHFDGDNTRPLNSKLKNTVVDMADDLEVVKELPGDISSAIVDGQEKQDHHTNQHQDTQIVRVTEKMNQAAESRHLGDKHDWGNGTPNLNSEDKHYWEKNKKTKANINNVNHRIKDFSANFFYPTIKHDFPSEKEADEKNPMDDETTATGVNDSNIVNTNNSNNTRQSEYLSAKRHSNDNATDSTNTSLLVSKNDRQQLDSGPKNDSATDGVKQKAILTIVEQESGNAGINNVVAHSDKSQQITPEETHIKHLLPGPDDVDDPPIAESKHEIGFKNSSLVTSDNSLVEVNSSNPNNLKNNISAAQDTNSTEILGSSSYNMDKKLGGNLTEEHDLKNSTSKDTSPTVLKGSRDSSVETKSSNILNKTLQNEHGNEIKESDILLPDNETEIANSRGNNNNHIDKNNQTLDIKLDKPTLNSTTNTSSDVQDVKDSEATSDNDKGDELAKDSVQTVEVSSLNNREDSSINSTTSSPIHTILKDHRAEDGETGFDPFVALLKEHKELSNSIGEAKNETELHDLAANISAASDFTKHLKSQLRLLGFSKKRFLNETLSKPPVGLPTKKISTVDRSKDLMLGAFKRKPTKPFRESTAVVLGGLKGKIFSLYISSEIVFVSCISKFRGVYFCNRVKNC